ncbi:unnamed protein product [Ascophyllum nodosum]
MPRRRLLRLPIAGVALLAGASTGVLCGAEGSERRQCVASRSRVPTSFSKEAVDAVTPRHYPAPRKTPVPTLLGDSSRLRGGWLGVDLVREIAKSYLTPGKNAGDGNPGVVGGRQGQEGGGWAGDGGRDRRRGGGRGTGTGSERRRSEEEARIRNALHFHRASSNPTGERGEGGGENAGITGVACSALGGGESEVSGDGRHRTSVSVPPVGGGGTGRSRPSSSSDEVPDRSDDGGVGNGDPLGDSGGRISTGAGTTAEDGVRNSEGGSGVAALGRDIARPGEEDRIDGKAASSDGGSDVRDGAGVGEEKRDEEATWAQAGVAADVAADATETERTRDEVAFLRDLQAMNAEERRRAEALPPLGQHARSVVTEAMPMRFVDEVGAQIASVLAIATAKALMSMILRLRRQKKPEKVLFDDVVGCDEAKEEIKQIMDFLVNPSKYDKLGASKPKGILLVGPPGTGKTLIAKACAGEANVPFLYACGSDFNGVYVGMGVASVKRLFAKARKHRKSIIYIDEIDFIGRSRNSGGKDTSGATQDREATLNQLLSEMDGFEGKDGIVVMASTNRKEILDDALLRSGRFDMQVDVDRPDRRGREQLFSKYITPLKLLSADEEGIGREASEKTRARSSTSSRRARTRGGVRFLRWRYFGRAPAPAGPVEVEKEKRAAIREQGLRDGISKELAELTPYMTGADVANVCATAGRIAAREGSAAVSREHFSAAVDRVNHGLEKPGKEVPREDKERTAVHEAGHAVAAWMLPWCDSVVKVSVVWRGNALGFSQSAMTERLSEMQAMVLDNVCMGLAGRAAEEVVLGTVSTGASADLRMASRQLYRAITEEGFGSSATGLLSPGDRWVSEKVLAEVDQEVKRILAEQYERALELVRRHRAKIDALSAALLEHQVVHRWDLVKLLGEKVTVESRRSEEAEAVEADARSTLKVEDAAIDSEN